MNEGEGGGRNVEPARFKSSGISLLLLCDYNERTDSQSGLAGWTLHDWVNPKLDMRISVRPFVLRPLSVTLRQDSETGWTGELWSKTNLLICQN